MTDLEEIYQALPEDQQERLLYVLEGIIQGSYPRCPFIRRVDEITKQDLYDFVNKKRNPRMA